MAATTTGGGWRGWGAGGRLLLLSGGGGLVGPGFQLGHEGGGVVEGDDEAGAGRLHQLNRERERGRDRRDAARHVLGDLGRQRMAEVRLVLQQGEPGQRALD